MEENVFRGTGLRLERPRAGGAGRIRGGLRAASVADA